MESNKISKIAINSLVESPYQDRYIPVNVGGLINTLKMDYRIVENLAQYKTTEANK